MKFEIHDDLPRHLTSDDYDDARQRFVEACTRAGLAAGSCGFFGTVRHPGVSDLDALAIGSVAQLLSLKEQVDQMRSSSPSFREILWHPPVYLVEDAVVHAHRLHTFENLDSVRARLARPVPPDAEASDHLHRVWSLFLIRSTSDLLSARQPVSLRTLLLVHKNLEHSRRHLASKLPNKGPAARFESDELRDAALDVHGVDRIRERFAAAAEQMMEAYDEVHARPHGNTRNSATLTPLRLTRSTIAHAGQRTAVRRIGRLKLIGVRGTDLALAHRFNGAVGEKSREEEQYLGATRAVAEIYRSTGLAYPFIGPLGLRPANA